MTNKRKTYVHVLIILYIAYRIDPSKKIKIQEKETHKSEVSSTLSPCRVIFNADRLFGHSQRSVISLF